MATKKEGILSEAYQRNPTLKNYVTLRRKNPSTRILPKYPDIEVVYRAVSAIEDDLVHFDIPSEVLIEAMLGNCPAISELSLTLMELLIERDAMQKSEMTHLISRGEVISDVLVNRLIGMMSEGVTHMNPDLLVLMKHQLTDSTARLQKQRERKLSIDDLRLAAIELAKANKKPSLRAIADVLGVAASTVLRSLPKTDLRRIQAAYDPSNLSKPEGEGHSTMVILGRYMDANTLVDFRAFTLAWEIILAHPNLPEAELLPMVENALRGSGARIRPACCV
jgi:hypothetical protein